MRPDPYVDNTPLEKTFEDLFVGADGNNAPVIGKISTSSNDPTNRYASVGISCAILSLR